MSGFFCVWPRRCRVVKQRRVLRGIAALGALVALLLLSLSAQAGITKDDFRVLVHQGDRAAVVAALQAAAAEDAEPGAEVWHARDLFEVFQEQHPDVQRFLAGWLADAPDDPLAMTAQGWQLYRQGSIWRGVAMVNQTWPERLETMTALHGQALDLMRRAFQARPDLLAASDGIFNLDQTVGPAAEIPVVLERVMNLAPNRWSLMQAMLKLAPQWGGTQAQVDLLCDRYAHLVKDVGEYDANICRIDAAFSAQYWLGPRRDAAVAALDKTHAPVLDYAREFMSVHRDGAYEWRRVVLRKAKDKRDLTVEEAQAWDFLTGALRPIEGASHKDLGGINSPQAVYSRMNRLHDQRDFTAQEQIQYEAVRTQVNGVFTAPTDEADKAKARLIDTARWNLKITPLDPDIVADYHDMVRDDLARKAARGAAPEPFPVAEMAGLMRASLALFPDDPRLWLRLGEDRLMPGPDRPKDWLDRMDEASPYIENAIAYAMSRRVTVSYVLAWRLHEIFVPSSPPVPADMPRRDAILICPATRQMILLLQACADDGIADDQCYAEDVLVQRVLPQFSQRMADGACPELTIAGRANLAYRPIAIDLSQPVN